MQKSKKGMQWLAGVAYAVVALVMIVGIGLTILTKLGDTTVTCGDSPIAGAWNITRQLCVNSTGATGAGTGGAYTAISYGATQLGSTGLLSWLPAIIALVIGLFFLASFMGKKKEY